MRLVRTRAAAVESLLLPALGETRPIPQRPQHLARGASRLPHLRPCRSEQPEATQRPPAGAVDHRRAAREGEGLQHELVDALRVAFPGRRVAALLQQERSAQAPDPDRVEPPDRAARELQHVGGGEPSDAQHVLQQQDQLAHDLMLAQHDPAGRDARGHLVRREGAGDAGRLGPAAADHGHVAPGDRRRPVQSEVPRSEAVGDDPELFGR